MASEIRVNRLSNRSGLSTITFANGGVQFSGITTFANGDFRVGIGATILNPTANEMQFHTAGSTRLTINNSGANLGTGSLTAVDATFSGNVSIGKTLTYEDVKNVDSVGVVTARTGINVSGGDLKVGTAITASSVTGNVTQDVGITTFSGSATWFKGLTANKDMYWSKSSGSLVFKDNSAALFGSSSDLQIKHDGSDSYIDNTTGGLYIRGGTNTIQLRPKNDEWALVATANGAVELAYDGLKKFETTTNGVTVTGTVAATSYTGDGSNLTGIESGIAGINTTASSDFKNLNVTGISTFSDTINFNSSNTKRLYLMKDGNDEFSIYNSSGYGYITHKNTSWFQLQTNGQVRIGSASSPWKTSAIFVPSGSVELNDNNEQRFTTSGYGVDIHENQGNPNSGARIRMQNDAGNAWAAIQNDAASGKSQLQFWTQPSGGSLAERMHISSDGDIYGPSGGRKNWFDNGSFDCREGRRANTSMDYGNHHAYGWVTDRFMSRNSVQWSRSTNVPTGKGFHSSTYTNGAGGTIMQAVELPDYGDMGVFTPGSYWCVSFWSTAACNHGGSAFSYDLGSTKTDITGVGPSSYSTTGETASGTSSGTFNRYYRVYGPMPSSIISGATGAYWIWGFSAQGYTTGFQLERVPTSTSKPTPYEHVHPAVTTARCRRYAWQFKNARLVGGYKRHDGQCSWQMQHPVLGTHMPSGSNQSADPYGVALHDAGIFTNFQGALQNPGVTSASRYEYDFRSGYFVMSAQSGWSSTHTFIPSWESAELEFGHGFF